MNQRQPMDSWYFVVFEEFSVYTTIPKLDYRGDKWLSLKYGIWNYRME